MREESGSSSGVDAGPQTLRILCVTGIYPPDIGGPATYLPRLCDALVARGHTIIVVTLSDLPGDDAKTPPFRVVRLPRRSWLPWRWARTLLTLLREGRWADVLFVHGLALEAALANLVLRKPMVHKVVGDLAWERATTAGLTRDSFEAFQRTRYGRRVEALKALRGWWTRRAARVIVPCAFLARWVAEWGVPTEKLAVVYNAVDIPAALPPIGISLPAGLKIAVAGRLVPWKRVDAAIRVLARLQDAPVRDAALVVIGDGPERQRLRDLAASLGVADRVVFAGSRSHLDTIALIAACDLFMLNSSYEGLPHVVLEAMTLGLPVVATSAGGTGELLQDGETGALIPPGDDAALGAALSGLLASPAERRRMGKAAQHSAAQFSFSSMVDQTEEVLSSSAGVRDG